MRQRQKLTKTVRVSVRVRDSKSSHGRGLLGGLLGVRVRLFEVEGGSTASWRHAFPRTRLGGDRVVGRALALGLVHGRRARCGAKT